MTHRRPRQIDCTPWCADAVGRDAIEAARLPRGYRLIGFAGKTRSSYRLTLYRLDDVWTVVGERATAIEKDVRPCFESLVDVAWIDARERHAA